MAGPGSDIAARSALGGAGGRVRCAGEILPRGRAGQLATLLTDADVATLRHLAERGMGKTVCAR